MEKKLPLYEMMIGDTIEGEEEVDFIALVEYPAIQKNFLAFSRTLKKTLSMTTHKAQRIMLRGASV
jgi:hypothetical protein